MAWVMRLTSGKATEEDASALRRWRDQSDSHRRAFAEAKLLWETLGPAARESAEGRGKEERYSPRTRPTGLVGRRAFIGGALAASAAAVGYFGSRPPFLLWPSMSEILADYRTGTGQQRRLAVTANVSLVLNTQTSINVRKVSSALHGIELIEGEAAVIAAAPFNVLAAGGWTSASAARFDVRCDGPNVCVTSLNGAVNVTKHDRSVTVPSGHQITYSLNGIGPVLPVDAAVAMAWQHGILIFRHEPLERVIAEVNRYRRGRIILIDANLAARDVVASFHLDRIDEVVEHVVQAFGARATFLPGGVVFLG
jgi:transmembrane sensor